MRRVVVTGLGLVTPLGVGVEFVWRRLLEGHSGLSHVTHFQVDDLPARVVGQVPRGPALSGSLDVDALWSVKERRRLSDFQLYALAAAREALDDAGWHPQEQLARERTGVLVGSGIGGLDSIADNAIALRERGPRRLSRAAIDVSQLDYVNAHATSTPLGDPIELRAVQQLCGPSAASLSMSSTKSAVGHLLGAAGAVEAIFSILALRDQVVPPTLNLHEPCSDELDLVPLIAKSRRVRYVLSNSFAFGGANAALVFGPP
ncbi:MAG: beta-ketoacyl-ACP synthase [Pseudomonadota bacterium]|jgi:3-oxoacyl-(acyl-carrier-protein) synthase